MSQPNRRVISTSGRAVHSRRWASQQQQHQQLSPLSHLHPAALVASWPADPQEERERPLFSRMEEVELKRPHSTTRSLQDNINKSTRIKQELNKKSPRIQQEEQVWRALRSRTSCAGLRGVAGCLPACDQANPVECKEVWRFDCPKFISTEVEVDLVDFGATYDQLAAFSAWSGRVSSGAGCVIDTRGN